jgi:hypothetical protein
MNRASQLRPHLWLMLGVTLLAACGSSGSRSPAAKPRTLYGDADHTGFKAAYSPDGTRIAFGCIRDLCLMNGDGSKVVDLLGVAGIELNHFAWGMTPKASP